MMIGTTVYEPTSFEIILGGIFMYAMGLISAIALLVYAIWKIGDKAENRKEESKDVQDDYVVE